VLTINGARVLVADDHDASRALHRALLTQIDGVVDVIDAVDGAAAVAVARATPLDVALLDLNMPRLDGIGAAARIAALQPATAIALHSSDPYALVQRARKLGLPLFDKADLERLVAWVAAQVGRLHDIPPGRPTTPTADRSCADCGYGIACAVPPTRCPMCGERAHWTLANTHVRAVR
jgi:CheY-like chemotaxis protein